MPKFVFKSMRIGHTTTMKMVLAYAHQLVQDANYPLSVIRSLFDYERVLSDYYRNHLVIKNAQSLKGQIEITHDTTLKIVRIRKPYSNEGDFARITLEEGEEV
jgi:hypothetical protein